MDPRIRYAEEIMERNYAARLRLGQIASELHLSPSRFKHLFKQETGQAFAARLREIRMTKARELLANESLSIKEVACEVGYSYHPNFVRAFRKRFGKAPSEYRNIVASLDKQ